MFWHLTIKFDHFFISFFERVLACWYTVNPFFPNAPVFSQYFPINVNPSNLSCLAPPRAAPLQQRLHLLHMAGTLFQKSTCFMSAGRTMLKHRIVVKGCEKMRRPLFFRRPLTSYHIISYQLCSRGSGSTLLIQDPWLDILYVYIYIQKYMNIKKNHTYI